MCSYQQFDLQTRTYTQKREDKEQSTTMMILRVYVNNQVKYGLRNCFTE